MSEKEKLKYVLTKKSDAQGKNNDSSSSLNRGR
jgi:hypothetical protein